LPVHFCETSYILTLDPMEKHIISLTSHCNLEQRWRQEGRSCLLSPARCPGHRSSPFPRLTDHLDRILTIRSEDSKGVEGEILKFRDRLSSIVSDHFDILLTGVQDYDMGETGVVPDAEYHHHYNHAHHHTQRRQVAGSVGGESQSAGLGIIIRCLCRWFPHDLRLCNEGDEMGMAAEKDIFSFPGAVAVKREQEGGHHGLHYAAGNQ